jgi:hypothetical protein
VLDELSDHQLVVLEGMNHLGPLLYPDLILSLATPAAEGRL